jgi:hypothetical protein
VTGLHRLPVEHGPERERLRVGQRVRRDDTRPDRRRVVCPPSPSATGAPHAGARHAPKPLENVHWLTFIWWKRNETSFPPV